ncbi:hypothetical protein BCR44DRAFT_380290 [Catenaria anguillulae PL171]|uniref:Uncharacterized protein n=1 Tax=Catenaria anguillulae PL171 TaxID=765915 RepID=A0A1Y2HKD1_9FUNG|nr:hypothetical protein BCR44DRAFT_380290 [Catenaria anguillulae PL171]
MGTPRPSASPKRSARVLTLLSLLAFSAIVIHAVHADPWAVPSWNKRAAASGSDNAEVYAASDANVNADFQAVNSPAPVVDTATASSSSTVVATTTSSSSLINVASTTQVSSSSSSVVVPASSPSSSLSSAPSSTNSATTTASAGAGGIIPFLQNFLQPGASVTTGTSRAAATTVPTQAGAPAPTAGPAAAAPRVQKRDTDFMPMDWIEGDTQSGTNPMDGPDVGTPNIVGAPAPAPPPQVPIVPQQPVPVVGQQSSSVVSSTSTTTTSTTTSTTETTTTTTATTATPINFNSIVPNVPVVPASASASSAPPASPTNPADPSPIQPRRVSSNPIDLRPPGYLPGIDSRDGDPATGPGAAFVPIQGPAPTTAAGPAPPGATGSPLNYNLQNTDMYAPGYVRGVDSVGGGNPAGGPGVGRPVIRVPLPRRTKRERDDRNADDKDVDERETFEVVADVLRGIERELFGDSKFSVRAVSVQDAEREHAVSADGRFDAVYDERNVEVVDERDERRSSRLRGRRGARKGGNLRSIGKSLRQALSRAQRRGDIKGAQEARKWRDELEKLTRAYQRDVKEARKNKNRGMAKRVAKQFIARVRELQAKSRQLVRKYAGRSRRGRGRRNNGVKSSSDLKNMIAKLAVQVKRDHKQVKAELKQQDERLVQLVNDLVQGRQARADQVRLAVMSLHEALRKVGLQLARYEAKHAAQDRRQLEKLNALDYQMSSLREANKVGSDEDKARREVEIAEVQSKRSLLTAQRASRQAKLIEVRSRARAVQANVKAFVTDLRRRAKEGPGSTEVKASEEAIERIRKELEMATQRVSGTALFRRPPKSTGKQRASAKQVKLTVALGPRGHKQLVRKVNAIIRDGRRVRGGFLKRGNAAGQIRVRVRLGRVVAETKLWHDASGKQLATQREQAGEQSEAQVNKIERQVKRLNKLHGKVQKRIQRAIKVVGKAIMLGEPLPEIARPQSRKEKRVARRNAAKARRMAKRNARKAKRDARRKAANDKRVARRNAAKAKRDARRKARQQRKNARRGRK